MSFNARLQNTQKALGVTGFTGAAPQSVTGNSVLVADVMIGTLSANVYAKATTSTLTLTAKWQVSDDDVTYRDVYLANRPANVTIVTGTGSAVVDNIVLTAPYAVYGKRYAKCIVTSGVGVGGGAGTDEANISYNWQRRESI